MAIERVRAKFEDKWITLTYNPSTDRYEGEITPQKTSINQPGGYYSLTVEATNSDGQSQTVTGKEYEPLQLWVRETINPSISLVSPTDFYLKTS